MKGDKVKVFMELAGQEIGEELQTADPASRVLGAQLLLSEVLEYVIHGLGVKPVVGGVAISDPDDLSYESHDAPDKLEMLDGLADVAYTMYWNSYRFGLPLEKAFELVCDNNLEKFVELESSFSGEGELERSRWSCGQEVCWPSEVIRVQVVEVGKRRYAVGTDKNGKVRKPSSYTSVDLKPLVS